MPRRWCSRFCSSCVNTRSSTRGQPSWIASRRADCRRPQHRLRVVFSFGVCSDDDGGGKPRTSRRTKVPRVPLRKTWLARTEHNRRGEVARSTRCARRAAVVLCRSVGVRSAAASLANELTSLKWETNPRRSRSYWSLFRPGNFIRFHDASV